ncbi:uncharacterized protein G2W53_037062 [Senna tora]|uniref:Uncharacterized protein n=1 Tax=Senna tora TaxID=362788 RepID=A0A834WAS9_9FABA|nr:uncharacterized protein G2W53_037062 [Senna tora]
MEEQGATASTIDKKATENQQESITLYRMEALKDAKTGKIAALLAAIATRKAGKQLRNSDLPQKKVQKSPQEQASAITPSYDGLVVSLLKQQEELKEELREAKWKLAENKSTAQKHDSKTARRRARSSSTELELFDSSPNRARGKGR